MVAAWISAETGVGPSIASSSQVCSGNCADFPQAASSNSRPIAVITTCDGAGGELGDLVERRGAEGDEDQADAEREPDVTDAVDHERLLGRGRCGRLVLPEPDQQVRRQAHALPAEEDADVVVGEHQDQHRDDEEVQVAEEPAPALVVLHVADRVDVDQPADPGDQQQEQRRERVVEQPELDLPVTGAEPGPQVQADLPVLGPATQDRDEQPQGADERAEHGRRTEQVAEAVGTPAAEQQHRGAECRQRDDEHQRQCQRPRRARVDDGDVCRPPRRGG